MADEYASEAGTLGRARQGDPEAYAELYRRHKDAVFRYAYYLSWDGALAEDYLVDAFSRAWRALPGYRPERPFRAYLLAIVRNLHRDRLAAGAAAGLPLEKAMAVASPSEGPCEAIQREELRRTVREAVDRLSEPLRSVVVLARLEGLKNREVADLLAIPEGTVESRLSAAYAKLRASLAAARGPRVNQGRRS
ncbi:MAG: sigma-70 family RNA polymerase sigma factor [Planctomycetes bacterium]|nr:sigma-70 family RNA polymerase sigma factor [Planctomycetota bacterium]